MKMWEQKNEAKAWNRGIKEITKINKKIILGKHGVIIDWKKVFLS